MDSEAQPAAAQMSAMDTLLDHVEEEATPLVDCAFALWSNIGPGRHMLAQ